MPGTTARRCSSARPKAAGRRASYIFFEFDKSLSDDEGNALKGGQ
jgi:hypothetical protein